VVDPLLIGIHRGDVYFFSLHVGTGVRVSAVRLRVAVVSDLSSTLEGENTLDWVVRSDRCVRGSACIQRVFAHGRIETLRHHSVRENVSKCFGQLQPGILCVCVCVYVCVCVFDWCLIGVCRRAYLIDLP
jgi:hypothetical protein